MWIAPNFLLALLAAAMWSKGLQRKFRFFFMYAVFEALQCAVLYPLDVIPWVRGETFWRAYFLTLLVEALISFLLISEIFAKIFDSYPAVARLGRFVIGGGGAILVIAAALTAARSPIENIFWAIPASHILQQAFYMVECGLLVLLFVIAGCFDLTWNREVFGIAFGLGISACVHLGTWAIIASGALPDKRYLLDFLNLATYHLCVLIWFYYLLVPRSSATASAISLPENNLAIWNRELERLLQQ
jgi:hypothetical protein